ncbi:MAG: MBL fold metallo-hydrolase [Candidatus Solibacter sp.]
MRTVTTALFLLVLTTLLPAADKMDMYAIDTEGGKAILTISPSGETMLVDLGWTDGAGMAGASTPHVIEALKALGVKRIDHFVMSHYDIDHIGDFPKLAEAIPVGHVYDHGDIQLAKVDDPRWAKMGETAKARFDAYAALWAKIGHTVVKPGDKIPIKGIDVQVIHAGAKWIDKPLRGAGAPNPACATAKQPDLFPRDLEDDASIGLLYTYGNFRYYDPADLEGHNAHALVCPNNPIGTVDLYQINVHGQNKGYSDAMVAALKAPVILFFNGTRKGGDANVWTSLHALTPPADIWALHFNEPAGAEKNPPPDFIANPQGPDGMKNIKISADQNGTFTVTNERNGFSKTYKK